MRQFKNLKKKTGCKGGTGTGVEVLIIDYNNVVGMPLTVYAKNFGITQNYTAAAGDKVTFGEAFTMKVEGQTTAKWSRFDFVYDSGTLEYETVGDKGYRALSNKLMGEISNAFDPAVLEWIDDLVNSCGYIVLIDLPELDAYGVFGSSSRPVEATFKGAKGKIAGDKNATTVEIEDASGLVMKLYPKALGVSILTD